MKSMKNIKQLIKKFHVTANENLDQKVREDILEVMKKSKQLDSVNQPNIWRIIMKTKITKFTTAAAMVVIVLFVLFSDGQNTLYAQVVKAFKRARSIHVVMTEHRDGHWFKDHEIWYDRKEGIREEERYENHADVRIDNKQYEWRYKVGDTLAAKVNSYRDPDEWAKDIYEWLRFEPERDPSGDKVIDGAMCRMYTLSTSEGGQKANLWVNENHRPLEFEREEQRNGQEIRLVANVEYDMEVDKNLFLPNFGSNVEIVGPRELIEEQFPLETAIFKRESLGFVYAVHELEFADGFKYLVCSNRLTEQTRDEISDGDPWTYYGGFNLFIRYDYDEAGLLLSTSDQPILLARMRHDGIQVDWYILIPGSSKTEHVVSCDVDVLVNMSNQLEEKLKAEDLPIREKFRLNITHEAVKEHSLSLGEIASQIYSFGEEFAPMVHTFSLTKIATEPDGNRIQEWKKPGVELSEEEYIKDLESRIEYYLNQK